MLHPTFVIDKAADEQFYFTLIDEKGSAILKGEQYKTKSLCINAINSVKVNTPYDNRYEKKTSADGKHYFNILSTAGNVLGVSVMYNSSAIRDDTIKYVMENAQFAKTEFKPLMAEH